MSKFIKHPFDFQIRSAIRREATAIRRELNIIAEAALSSVINYSIPNSVSLVATPDVSDETGTNPLDIHVEIMESGSSLTSTFQGVIAEPILGFGAPFDGIATLIATPAIDEEGGTGGIESTTEILYAFDSQGSFGYASGITAEPELAVI